MTHRLHKGQPKTADVPTRAVLEAVQASRASDGALLHPEPAVRLQRRFGCCPKVAYSAMSREVPRHLEYGTSIRLPWLTPTGREYLENTP